MVQQCGKQIRRYRIVRVRNAECADNQKSAVYLYRKQVRESAQGVVVDLLHAGGRVHPDVAVGQHVQRVLPLPEAPQMRGANPELRELVQNGGHLVGSGLIKGKK